MPEQQPQIPMELHPYEARLISTLRKYRKQGLTTSLLFRLDLNDGGIRRVLEGEFRTSPLWLNEKKENKAELQLT